MNDRIVIDPAICHGKPIIRGARTPVTVVLDALAGGDTFEMIQSDYDITADDIRRLCRLCKPRSQAIALFPRAGIGSHGKAVDRRQHAPTNGGGGGCTITVTQPWTFAISGWVHAPIIKLPPRSFQSVDSNLERPGFWQRLGLSSGSILRNRRGRPTVTWQPICRFALVEELLRQNDVVAALPGRLAIIQAGRTRLRPSP